MIGYAREGDFYRGEGGVEVNIAGRLVGLLLKVRDSELRVEMEGCFEKFGF